MDDYQGADAADRADAASRPHVPRVTYRDWMRPDRDRKPMVDLGPSLRTYAKPVHYIDTRRRCVAPTNR